MNVFQENKKKNNLKHLGQIKFPVFLQTEMILVMVKNVTSLPHNTSRQFIDLINWKYSHKSFPFVNIRLCNNIIIHYTAEGSRRKLQWLKLNQMQNFSLTLRSELLWVKCSWEKIKNLLLSVEVWQQQIKMPLTPPALLKEPTKMSAFLLHHCSTRSILNTVNIIL